MLQTRPLHSEAAGERTEVGFSEIGLQERLEAMFARDTQDWAEGGVEWQ